MPFDAALWQFRCLLGAISQKTGVVMKMRDGLPPLLVHSGVVPTALESSEEALSHLLNGSLSPTTRHR